jgi:hypothetical protein
MKQSLGIDFIVRTLRTTGIVLLIFLPFGVYYFGPYPALAVFFGGVWGMINLIFLSSLIRSALRPDHVDKVKVAGLMLIKFPLLYVSGYFLLKVPQFAPLHLLIGFSIIIAVMLMKSVAVALLRTGGENSRSERLSGVS